MILVKARVLDSTHLELAKPIAAGCGGQVFVVVAESTHPDDERKHWLDGSLESLQNAYGDSEPEYALSMVRESNPGYGV